MDQPIVYSEDETGVGLLRVNRPEARNALNWAAQEQFAAVVDQLAARAQGGNAPRVLIITGAGDQAFVSGGDLKELAQHPEPEAGQRLNQTMGAALDHLTRLPMPVVAAVNGDAFGGGCEILTACDLRLALAGVRFSFRQVQNGLTTGWGGTARLVALLGQSLAVSLLLTGRAFGAAEALNMGFVHGIVDNDVLGAAQTLATELVALPAGALAATKTLIRAAATGTAQDTNRLESALFVDLWPSADHLEAMRAFTEKRPPRFNQRQ